MSKTIIRCIFVVSAAAFIFSSCGSKRASVDKQFEKAQKIYSKDGMEGFCKYLKKNAYLPVKDSTRNEATPLLIAVKNGDLETAKLFLEKGASVEEKDANNRDVLDYALEQSSTALLDFVISKMPASYWNTSDDDDTFKCIKIIMQCSDFDIVKQVLDVTSDINHADKNGKTPLMYAAQYNADVRTVKYLLDKGAKIDAKNRNEWTALMYAVRYNPNPTVMEDLILRGANTQANSVGLTITMLASCNPNPGVLLTFLKYINDVNSTTDKGKTAMMYACENGQDSSVIKMLIDSHADLHAKDENGKTALMYALEHYAKPEAIYVLLSAGAKTDDTDNAGKTVRDYLSSNKKLSSNDIENAIAVAKSMIEVNNQQVSDSPVENKNSTEIQENNAKDTEPITTNTEGRKK